jgi:hypothetical protein
LQHIICRGIQRCRIYQDDSDRQDFLCRLGQILVETWTTCYAWALIPNHFHCALTIEYLGISGREVSRQLHLSASAVSKLLQRGCSLGLEPPAG